MNDKRRNELRKAIDSLDKAASIVDTALEEEQDAVYNIPENLQLTEKSELMEAAVDSLSDAVDKIDEAKTFIEAAI